MSVTAAFGLGARGKGGLLPVVETDEASNVPCCGGGGTSLVTDRRGQLMQTKDTHLFNGDKERIRLPSVAATFLSLPGGKMPQSQSP